MIFGVDHIALSCTNIDQGIENLRRQGYALRFLERDAPNHPQKKSYLKTYEPNHDLAYCVAWSGPGIELTAHGSKLHKARSPYEVVFIPGSGIISVCVKVRNLKSSRIFWTQGLGFSADAGKSSSGNGEDCALSLKAPIQNWSLDLTLSTSSDMFPCTLDSEGYPCLALLTSQLDEDISKAESFGGNHSSEPFELQVNGKNLKVALIKGPNHEIVEFIQISKD